MKIVFQIFLIILSFIFLTACSFSGNKHLNNIEKLRNNKDNNLKNTNFIYYNNSLYDLKSYKYDKNNDMYSIDVAEELDSGGDMDDIPCPYGEGNISHVITATKYSPNKKYFSYSHKGFICSILIVKYENDKPISAQDKFKGIYYDNKYKFAYSDNMNYFANLKKEIDNPNKYNYFGFVQSIRHH